MARILVVEDELDIADNLVALLGARGHKAVAAHDGPEGIARARKEVPDLILLDVMLPRMSGLDVCKILKTEAKTSKIKVIMVTGLGRGGDVETGLDAGADDYLIKPFDTERLLKKIDRVLALP